MGERTREIEIGEERVCGIKEQGALRHEER
jgi:hypothetical protein